MNGRYTSQINTSCRINANRTGYLLDSGPMAIQSPVLRDESPPARSVESADRPLSRFNHNYPQHSILPQSHIVAEQPVALSDTCDASCSRAYLDVKETACPIICGTNDCKQQTDIDNSNLPVLNGITKTGLLTEAKRSAVTRTLSYADVSAVHGETWNIPKPENEWIQVQRKRLRNRFVGYTGKAELSCSSTFKAAGIRIPLFVSNVDTNVNESDIVDYIYGKTGEKVSLTRMKMRKEKGYNSFKVFVSKSKIDTFLDDSFWPCGISFRRFVYRRHSDSRPDDGKTSTMKAT
jgi:hypothetical protein